jgi:hypothetical protein
MSALYPVVQDSCPMPPGMSDRENIPWALLPEGATGLAVMASSAIQFRLTRNQNSQSLV